MWFVNAEIEGKDMESPHTTVPRGHLGHGVQSGTDHSRRPEGPVPSPLFGAPVIGKAALGARGKHIHPVWGRRPLSGWGKSILGASGWCSPHW